MRNIEIKEFNGISVNSNDILKETKDLLLSDNADWIPTDIGGLLFKIDTIKSLLSEDYFDDDNRPSKECINEIKYIIKKSKNSSIVYLY